MDGRWTSMEARKKSVRLSSITVAQGRDDDLNKGYSSREAEMERCVGR